MASKRGKEEARIKQLNLWSERHQKLELLVEELEGLMVQVVEAEKAVDKANAALTAWSTQFRHSTAP